MNQRNIYRPRVFFDFKKVYILMLTKQGASVDEQSHLLITF